MGKKTPPAPPDPKTTAAAQTSTNISTAQANAVLGNVNQITPQGTLTYNQTGSQFIADPNGAVYWRGPNGEMQSSAPQVARAATSGPTAVAGRGNTNGYNGPNGGYRNTDPALASMQAAMGGGTTNAPGWSQQKGYYIPQYTAEQKYSPGEQAKYEASTGAEINLANIAKERSAWLQSYLQQAPPTAPTLESSNLTREQVQKALFDRMQPGLDQASQQNEVDLVNKGVRPGSQQYDRGRDEVGRNTNDARLAAILSAGDEQSRQYGLQLQQFGAQTQARSQPLNEIIGLLNGSQVQQPQYASANMPTIPTVDYAGLVNENYGQKMAAWQQKQQMTQSLIGGVMGVGASLLGNPSFFKSDRRAKRGINRVGDYAAQIPLYEFNYHEDPPEAAPRTGVMAQDVLPLYPEAVRMGFGGYWEVNYDLLNRLTS